MIKNLFAKSAATSAALTDGLSRYHCCIQKTASQWFAAVFEDETFQRSSGITEVHRPKINFLRKDDETRAKFATMPTGKLVTPLYIDYPDFLQQVAKGPWMASVVIRDPRDIIISGYFSVAKSHALHNEDMARRRKQYTELGQEKGIMQQINDGVPYYEALRSWIPALRENKVSVFRYEDVFGANHQEVFQDYLRSIGIFLKSDDLTKLCDKHSFERKSGGRKPGEEDQDKHLRKGIAGDWQNYLNEEHLAKMESLCGDVIDAFGYREMYQ